MNYSIAIDGPAGAGKSTIAKRIAKQLSFIYVDTGAMYRTMALYFLRNSIDPKDEKTISESCDAVKIDIRYENEEQQVYLNDENVTSYLRTEEVGNMASKTSIYPKVRLKLVELQRQLAETTNVVMDGRDIGTYVLKDSPVKIYLTASVKTRAMRRYKELVEKGEKCELAEIEKEISQRDAQDMNREISPLKQADDALLIDSSEMTIDEVVDKIVSIYHEKTGA